MNFKPFKPLTIRKQDNSPSEPPAKRQKLDKPCTPVSTTSSPLQTIPRKPLQPLPNGSSSPEAHAPPSSKLIVSYYSVLWRTATNKKHKTWEGDGALLVDSEATTFYDTSGRVLGKLPRARPLLPGSTLSISGRELEVEGCLTKDEFRSMVKSKTAEKTRPKVAISSVQTLLETPRPQVTLKEQIQNAKDQAAKPPKSKTTSRESEIPHHVAFKLPVKELSVQVKVCSDVPVPKHDPAALDAVVFKRPSSTPPGREVVDVVLDPVLTNKLQPHQREGVMFLYECVMGLRDFGGQGCILADDMGLGKTLQTIALLWTLIKQNPVYRAAPVVKKALIVCPVSLIRNWKNEFKKWLRHTNIGVLEFEDSKTTRLSMFDGKVFNVLIIGYERLRMVADDLAESHDIDIVICDEGHRLKTVKNKSAKAIEALNTPRRVILSGTPIQNDLGEFYAMVNFVNDGCLGSAKAFLKDFENPIMRSRQPDASEEDAQKGEEASTELSHTTSPFILRRKAEILADFLPTKTEYVLFCKPTPQQAAVYRKVVECPMFRSAMGSMETAFQLITILKKLCNSPALMRPDTSSDATTSSSLTTLNEMLPSDLKKYYQNSASSKIRLLDALLQEVQKQTDEKVVLVSNYTSTLNLMEKLLENSNLKYLRLDGSVPASRRQGLVEQFNRTSSKQVFAFLLSAKAGGVGIDLTGASRLVLFDVDWNPATDDQAIARIHRQGQKRPTKVYRFLIRGSLEEKIWQRQVVKRGLADSIMNVRKDAVEVGQRSTRSSMGGGGKATFTQEELKDLFRFDESEGLRTHDLIDCSCAGVPRDGPIESPKQVVDEEEPFWKPESREVSEDEEDLPDISTIVRASQFPTEYPENEDGVASPAKKARKQSGKKQGDAQAEELMRYLHLDTSRVCNLEDEALSQIKEVIRDECLMHVLQQSEQQIAGSVAWVFKKVTGSDTVPAQADAVEAKHEKLAGDFFT
jgi:DNA repair and recombination protein RAD54B